MRTSPRVHAGLCDNNSMVFKYFQGLCVDFQAPHCLLGILIKTDVQGKIEASNDEKS